MNETEFEKVSLSDMKILRLFVNTFTAYNKYYVLKREYLTHPIHMQLSQKQKVLSELFSDLPKPRLYFEHIQKKKKKKIAFVVNVFPKLLIFKNALT